jgi:hypothetical protein
MAITRRRFVTVSALATLGAAVGHALKKADAAVAATAPVLRPAAVGSSTSRCARCGSPEHSALDEACPEGAEVRQALQASARRLAARGREEGRHGLGRADA